MTIILTIQRSGENSLFTIPMQRYFDTLFVVVVGYTARYYVLKIKINYFRRAAKPHPTPPCNGLIFCGKFTKIVPNEERIYYYYY